MLAISLHLAKFELTYPVIECRYLKTSGHCVILIWRH